MCIYVGDLNASGSWISANTLPTGIWKNANNFNLEAGISGVFIKLK